MLHAGGQPMMRTGCMQQQQVGRHSRWLQTARALITCAQLATRVSLLLGFIACSCVLCALTTLVAS
jgi:hypothetical protein